MENIENILEKVPQKILINCASEIIIRKQGFPIIPGATYSFNLDKRDPFNYYFEIPLGHIIIRDLRAKLEYNSLLELDQILLYLKDDSSISEKEFKLNKKLYKEDEKGIYELAYKYSSEYLKLKKDKLHRLINLLVKTHPQKKESESILSLPVHNFHTEPIKRDVQGIKGLHIIYDVFTEEAEKRYFFQPNLWPPTELLTDTHSRTGTIVSLYEFPRELFELCNAIQDSGFIVPERFIIPDYCLCLSYPVGSTFSAHFDSRYRWGLYIVGVNLGAPCILTMSYPKEPEKTQKIILPRRSIYVFSDDSRYVYKHAISKINGAGTGELANKTWNATGIRRSFTLRCTKVYETVVLEKRLKEQGPSPVLNDMIRENKLYKPRGDYGETRPLTSEQINEERRRAEFQLSIVTKEDMSARMPKSERMF